MSGKRWLLTAVCLLALACTQPTPTPTPQPTPTFTPQPSATATPLPTPTPGPRLILLSLDGARADSVDHFLADGTMLHLAHLVAQGVKAAYAQTVDPSLTAPAHISLATGAYPARTGIVANTFHTVTDPIYRTTRGFNAPFQAEPLWVTARRAGQRVITIAFPGADGTEPARRGELTLAYGVRDGYSFVKYMTASHFGEAEGWDPGDRTFEHSRANLGTRTANRLFFRTFEHGDFDLNILVADTVFDGLERYDTAFLDFDKDLSNGFQAELREGEWGTVILPLGPGLVGAWVKLLRLSPDLAHFDVYLGGSHHNTGYPPSFVAAIDHQVGFWPGSPDSFQLEAGRIDEATYLEQMARLADYLMDATLYALAHYDWDLVLTYQPQTDEAGHQFLLLDEHQRGYSPQRAELYARYYRYGYQLADENLGRLLEAVDLSDTAIFVTSDHGMAPIHSYVNVNVALIQAGLLVLQDTEQYRIDVAKTRANAVTSGGAVHIYINLQGREEGGIVPPEDYEEVQEEIVRVLTEIRDPLNSQPVFPRILKRQDLAALHLDASNAGDVFAQARPGYYPDFHRDRTEIFQPTEFYGQHGYNATLPWMRAIFVAAGPGIKEGVTVGPVRLVDLAPTAARLLGFAPPETAEGRVLTEILK
ncbi:MAG: alkaline phosphatase family protein [Anaerolineae bacterium]